MQLMLGFGSFLLSLIGLVVIIVKNEQLLIFTIITTKPMSESRKLPNPSMSCIAS
ncbi:putative holin-like toxin [Streptococcus equi subsp. equi]|nr:putative holin-like toxin [Streptococcus equi subsp. equi]